MLNRWLLVISLLSLSCRQASSADEPSVSIHILSKFHPQTVQIETAKRLFLLQPGRSTPFHFSSPIDEPIKLTVNKLTENELTENTLTENKLTENNSETRHYRGSLDIIWRDGEYHITHQTPLEIYVAGVIVGEIGSQAEAEMIKAQAILARTYALQQLQRGSLSDLAYHQVFKGYDHYADQLYKITQQTAGKLLLDNGKLADALFHSECGSAIYSANQFWPSDQAFEAIPLPTDIAPGQAWQRLLTTAQIDSLFGESSSLKRLETWPIRIEVGNRSFNAESFRLKVNRQFGWDTIPSNEFDIQPTNDGWKLTGRGRGHLVGLCQQQANELAKQGWSATEILRLFYPGTLLSQSIAVPR